MRSRAGQLVLVGGLMACSSAGPIQQAPPPEDGRRPTPLTVEEAARILARKAPRFGQCYDYERLNLSLPDGADYVAQVFVPNDGSAPVVDMVAASVPGLRALEECLLRELRTTRFPAHVGEPITINVPIKAPR